MRRRVSFSRSSNADNDDDDDEDEGGRRGFRDLEECCDDVDDDDNFNDDVSRIFTVGHGNRSIGTPVRSCSSFRQSTPMSSEELAYDPLSLARPF